MGYDRQTTPAMDAMAEDGMTFENAIAPAPWTLPSHVSMFTGQYPHEHKIFKPSQSPSSYPLLKKIGDQYNTYGVSGNPFFSHHTGAYEAFDEFYYTTPTIFTDGLTTTIYDCLASHGSHRLQGKLEQAGELFREIMGHDHSLKSLANFLSVTALPIIRENEILNRVPHPRFNEHDLFSYSPNRNTEHIKRIIRSEADSDGSFFIFANYVDTHRPYIPPPEYQQQHLGRELSYRELSRIDKAVGDTWNPLERLYRKEVSEDEIDTLQKLYAGTVNSVDDHLRQVLNVLNETDSRDDTLIVVTSDHGEALGEPDEMGRERVGHQMTFSEHVLRVPLVVAHPDIDQIKIEEYASLKNLYHLIMDSNSNKVRSSMVKDNFVSSDGIVASEDPPKNVLGAYERYPDIPDHIIREEISEYGVVAYQDNWKVLRSSNGGSCAWKEGVQRDLEDAPERVCMTCENHLDRLVEEESNEIDPDSVEQLESLGYI